ncbi:aminomethyl-transferring glycine dehydrogenase subunit GcvPA [Haloplanus salinarum]|uniref:aminomethyl-transferring glycine dehydrogenase subunit GcvPA n=1 Tax=Haloplanus salinarum TaxID=1912324 RepID=UPI00214D0A91|nr:aminomethyl-transferring glycine dehydrogenase subunit GcvPA [Haloplanus salinarum]
MPYVTHSEAERSEMLDAVGVSDPDELFDIPDPVRFDGDYGIEAHSERETRAAVEGILEESADLTEFLGGGHYEHYVPSVVDHLSLRGEFLTSYTQYQPEVTQGFLQALFEFQSLVVELTGLGVANCSMYDRSTALGEAVLLADRVRATDGDTVLVPADLPDRVRSVLENYTDGPGITVESYPTSGGTVDVDGLAERIDGDTSMVYAATPNARGVLEPDLAAVGDLADDNDALFCVGSDAVALALLEPPAAYGADVVVGDAGVLGLPTTYGMGLGLFACREDFLRQVPGRLVGAGEDTAGNRAYTLTLQTREQHIRRERATSNICTNQAWLALRAAIHAAWLGPDGLVDLAEESVTGVAEACERIDALDGFEAPVYDGHHFREALVDTAAPAADVVDHCRHAGLAVRTVEDAGEERLAVCVTDANRDRVDDLLDALAGYGGGA